VDATERVYLRRGRPDDWPAIVGLLKREDMANGLNAEECLVAEGLTGLLGCARIEMADGVAYLRPIIVAAEGQRRGVGRLLVESLAADLSELRVVARGPAMEFYRKLGFKTIGWETVAPEYVAECQDCPRRETCQPMPMTRKSTHSIPTQSPI
jgi:amino-acid N-acetyltransferase